MQKQLAIVAGVLGLVVILLYARYFLFRQRPPSPEEAARAALNVSASPQTREEAAVRLATLGRPAVGQMVQVLKASDQSEVRAACVRGLGQAKSYNSMALLLQLMNDQSLAVRAQAGASVKILTRIDCDFRPEAPERERLESINRFRRFWENEIKPSYRRGGKWKVYILQQQGAELDELNWESG
jgi:hypothetical protein